MITKLETLPLVDEDVNVVPELLIDTIETFQFSIICFTIPFYFYIVLFLINAQLQRLDGLCTAFFKLCVFTSGVDIITLLNNYFGAMMAKWGWFSSTYLLLNNYWARTYLYISWSSGICQAMCCSILTANRVSAIFYPNKYRTMWSGRNLAFAIFLQYFPGFSVGLVTFLNPPKIFRNRKNGLVPKFSDADLLNKFFLIAGTFLAVNCAFLVGAYVYIFIVLHQKNRKSMIQSRGQRARRKAEFKLFVMSSIIVGIQLFFLVFLINSITITIEMSSDTYHLIYNATSDLYAGINPYLLWIFSDSLRRSILRQLGFQRKKKSMHLSNVTIITAY